jgi:hypothetical protein
MTPPIDPETGEFFDLGDVAPPPRDDVAVDVTEDDQESHAYETVEEFYSAVYAPLYSLFDPDPSAMASRENNVVWCPVWTEHQDVVARLTAVWFAWETANEEGGKAVSSWIRDHADYEFAWCMAETGPFRRCRSGHSPKLTIYPTETHPTETQTGAVDADAEPDTKEN